MTLRKYVPNVGQTVKMREWNDYASRGIHMWARLKVTAIVDETVSFEVLNGDQPTNQHSACNVSAINPPLGWEPRYTIYCSQEQANRIVSDWFNRGIIVRTNHDMSSSRVGAGAFTPMDSNAHPGWQYPELTDAIPANECSKLFRVVVLTTEEINHYSNPEHPNLRAMGRTARGQAIKAMRDSGWSVKYIPYAGGFWERQKETVIHDWSE